ncbi:hypothetical protein LZ30DRAFT_686274 [Colletotrichum cereale]|nr:hypothetical protein LZ30DRAFT_686274 [Colletotrichum cereale]
MGRVLPLKNSPSDPLFATYPDKNDCLNEGEDTDSPPRQIVVRCGNSEHEHETPRAPSPLLSQTLFHIQTLKPPAITSHGTEGPGHPLVCLAKARASTNSGSNDAPSRRVRRFDKNNKSPNYALAAKTGIVDTRKLALVMRTLCAHHIFAETDLDVFANGEASTALATDERTMAMGLIPGSVLTVSPNGRQRTVHDLSTVVEAAGLEIVKVCICRGLGNVVECRLKGDV